MLKRVKIGKISTPHGVRGEFRVLPLTDFPERFKSLTDAFLDDGRPVVVESARPHKQFYLLKLKGFDTPEAVTALRNMTLEVDRSAVAQLPPGHYYVFDLVGMHVFTADGEELGEISDVLETGSNDVYVVEPKSVQEKKMPQILIPALKSVVLDINISAKKMVVQLPEGLI